MACGRTVKNFLQYLSKKVFEILTLPTFGGYRGYVRCRYFRHPLQRVTADLYAVDL